MDSNSVHFEILGHIEADYVFPLGHIEIEGSPAFIGAVEQMLRQIEGSCAERTVALLKGIREVASYEETGMNPNGWFDVALWVLGNTTWGTSQIVHDAEHYRRMLTGEFLGLCRQEELAAFAVQADYLMERGAWLQAIYVRSLNGSHVDPRAAQSV